MVTHQALEELHSEADDEIAFDIEVKTIEWNHPHLSAADLVPSLEKPVSD